MKKRYVQKITTILLTAAMICSSVPVTAETVSENEATVIVDPATEQGDAEEPENKADTKAQTEEADETAEETDEADITADQIMGVMVIEQGKEGNLYYNIYQRLDEPQYVEITDCDKSAEGAIEVPSVKNIGKSAFFGCKGLKDVYYAGTEK